MEENLSNLRQFALSNFSMAIFFVFVCYILWTCYEQNDDRGSSFEIETFM